MAAPYQPGYSQLNSGRFGFRFKPEPFVDNITPAYGMDADKNVSPPPNMNVNPNQQSQTMQFQNPGDNNNDDNYQQAANQNRLAVAGSYGYDEVGKSNPMGALPGGSFLTNFLYGKDAKFNFGQPGTTDTAGNIFAESPASGINRSYDPITGAPVGYKDPSDWGKSWTGLGTEEGLGGPSSSYGQLRAAGVNPIASALGSYEDSSYYIPWEDRQYGVTPANLAGINDTGARLRYNTYLQNPDLIPDYTLGAANTMPPGAMNPGDFSRAGDLYNIPKEQLGFDGSRMEGSGLRNYDPATAQYMDRSLLGTQDAIPGQVVRFKDGKLGIVNEDGTIQTSTGTVIQTGGNWNPDLLDEDGNKVGGWENRISLLGSRDPNKITGEIDSALDPNTIKNKPGFINPLDEGFIPDEIIYDPWNNMYGDGRGYEDGTKPGSFTPTDTWYDPGYTVDTTPGGWTDEPGYEMNTNWSNDTYNPVDNLNANWSNDTYNPANDPTINDYISDSNWNDEPGYDTESSSDLSSSVNEGAEGDVVGGSDSVSFSDDAQYTDPYGGDYGFWNKGGQIPNRAGGK